MNEKLKSFIQEAYTKVKKAKKSPKNFYIFKEFDDYVLVSTDRAYTGTAQTPVGILNDLYLDIQIDKAKDVITIVTSTTNKNLCIGQPPVVKPDAYTGFDIHWIPLFKAMLLAESFEEMTYSELDSSFTDIVSEKSFNNIVNWLKTN